MKRHSMGSTGGWQVSVWASALLGSLDLLAGGVSGAGAPPPPVPPPPGPSPAAPVQIQPPSPPPPVNLGKVPPPPPPPSGGDHEPPPPGSDLPGPDYQPGQPDLAGLLGEFSGVFQGVSGAKEIDVRYRKEEKAAEEKAGSRARGDAARRAEMKRAREAREQALKEQAEEVVKAAGILETNLDGR